MRCARICADPEVEGFAEHKALDENEDLAGTGWAESIGFQARGLPLRRVRDVSRLFLMPKLSGTNGCLVRWEAAGRPFPPPRARPVIYGVVDRLGRLRPRLFW